MLTRKQLNSLRVEKKSGPNRLKRAMQLADVTQEQVAAAVGVSQSHISEIANGNYSRLPIDMVQNLAGYFGCSTDDLFPARQAVAS